MRVACIIDRRRVWRRSGQRFFRARVLNRVRGGGVPQTPEAGIETDTEADGDVEMGHTAAGLWTRWTVKWCVGGEGWDACVKREQRPVPATIAREIAPGVCGVRWRGLSAATRGSIWVGFRVGPSQTRQDRRQHGGDEDPSHSFPMLRQARALSSGHASPRGVPGRTACSPEVGGRSEILRRHVAAPSRFIGSGSPMLASARMRYVNSSALKPADSANATGTRKRGTHSPVHQ